LEKKGNVYEFNIPGIKSQIGKDITRLDLIVNSQIQNFKTMIGGTPNNTPDLNNQLNDNNNIEDLNDLSITISKEEEEDIRKSSKLLEENYDKITDKYFEVLMNKMISGSSLENLINFNILNEIALLSCQNIFNFIAELIQIEIKNLTQNVLNDNYILISPSSREDAQGKKTISNPKTLNIDLENGNKKVSIYFDSYLFTSSDFSFSLLM
jgi:hypothetical protein